MYGAFISAISEWGMIVRVLHLYNSYPTAKDNRDSWGMRTTSVEYKIVLTVVLTVMSSMDPHMISWDWYG
jgi:hypothetical protein